MMTDMEFFKPNEDTDPKMVLKPEMLPERISGDLPMTHGIEYDDYYNMYYY